MNDTLIPPTTMKGVRSFLRHAGFYRRFINEFSKIARPLCRSLENDTKFDFYDACKFEFEEINIGTKIFKSCVMLVTLLWEHYWGRE